MLLSWFLPPVFRQQQAAKKMAIVKKPLMKQGSTVLHAAAFVRGNAGRNAPFICPRLLPPHPPCILTLSSFYRRPVIRVHSFLLLRLFLTPLFPSSSKTFPITCHHCPPPTFALLPVKISESL